MWAHTDGIRRVRCKTLDHARSTWGDLRHPWTPRCQLGAPSWPSTSNSSRGAARAARGGFGVGHRRTARAAARSASSVCFTADLAAVRRSSAASCAAISSHPASRSSSDHHRDRHVGRLDRRVCLLPLNRLDRRVCLLPLGLRARPCPGRDEQHCRFRALPRGIATT
jgi:hypothetical protein